MSTLNGGPGNIVTNGLAWYLDVLNTNCYISGSTTFRNVGFDTGSATIASGNTYTGISLYSTSSTGNQVLWTNAYPGFTTPAGTYDLWIKVPNGTTTSQTLLFYGGGTSNNLVYLYRNTNFSPTSQYRWLIYYTGSAGIGSYLPAFNYNPNQWYNTVMTHTSDGTGSVYVNGVRVDTQNMSNFTSWNRTAANTPNVNMFVTSSGAGTVYGEFGAFRFYNRALTQTEVLQNYNSTKARFGL
jgi:hypothetical protein